ncbi:DNA-methyltransferase [Mycoplana rhizolycopersici]|uniref:Methyltransferase n=1 Tax=Mycoplana rhizolycopersici TaxID=2746702 RepID=A0ABX2QDN5_9HYPH|nr:site-specific DNA-methyltransferase [Rhizobium rhizolycopersici]NVP54481.1 site-specific DNA-methyltransferase [Rhizobium rhizolycopersici]
MTKIRFLSDRVTLHVGDCLTVLTGIPDESVDCIVTSPPYWGLRDYGVEGQIGLEPTLAEHLDVMVRVFEEVRRILKKTGTCWINYGDCYATTPNGRSAAATKAASADDRTFRDKPFSTIQGVLKPKDLCMVPNRLAIALQEVGWWVRSEIIWAKKSPMPDSAKDRPGVAHEKIFLLTKSGRYWYDADAVRFDLRPKTYSTYGTVRRILGDDGSGKVKEANLSKSLPVRKPKVRAADVASPRHAGHINHTGIESTPRGEGRNLRNYEPAPLEVWPIATKPFAEAHFATFPPELAERCILAGCPRDGVVLDPFGGAGTTALAALRHSRLAALIELNPTYAEIAQRRIETEWGEYRAPRVDEASALADFPMFRHVRGANA